MVPGAGSGSSGVRLKVPYHFLPGVRYCSFSTASRIAAARARSPDWSRANRPRAYQLDSRTINPPRALLWLCEGRMTRCFSESKLSAESFIEVSYNSRVFAGSCFTLMWRGAAGRASGNASQVAKRSTGFDALRMHPPCNEAFPKYVGTRASQLQIAR